MQNSIGDDFSNSTHWKLINILPIQSINNSSFIGMTQNKLMRFFYLFLNWTEELFSINKINSVRTFKQCTLYLLVTFSWLCQ